MGSEIRIIRPVAMRSKRALPLILLLCACGGDPEESNAVSESAAHAEVRKRLLVLMREATDAAPIVVDDETVRREVPEKPGPEAILSYLRGACVQVPTAGLQSAEMALSDEGLAITLRCADSVVRLLDRSGSPAARKAYQTFFAAGLELRSQLWPTGPSDEDRALHRNLARVESRYRGRFEAKGDEGLHLTRVALRSKLEGAAKEGLDDLFGVWELLEVKRLIVAEVGGVGGAALEPLAAGPTLGILKGLPGRDSRVRARIEGPGGMLVMVEIEAPDGQPVPPRWDGLISSLRPFATNDVSASYFERLERLGDGQGPAVSALNHLSALLLAPTTERAVSFLRALSTARPSDSAVDLDALARALGPWLRLPAAATERLLRYSEGD